MLCWRDACAPPPQQHTRAGRQPCHITRVSPLLIATVNLTAILCEGCLVRIWAPVYQNTPTCGSSCCFARARKCLSALAKIQDLRLRQHYGWRWLFPAWPPTVQLLRACPYGKPEDMRFQRHLFQSSSNTKSAMGSLQTDRTPPQRTCRRSSWPVPSCPGTTGAPWQD